MLPTPDSAVAFHLLYHPQVISGAESSSKMGEVEQTCCLDSKRPLGLNSNWSVFLLIWTGPHTRDGDIGGLHLHLPCPLEVQREVTAILEAEAV